MTSKCTRVAIHTSTRQNRRGSLLGHTPHHTSPSQLSIRLAAGSASGRPPCLRHQASQADSSRFPRSVWTRLGNWPTRGWPGDFRHPGTAWTPWAIDNRFRTFHCRQSRSKVVTSTQSNSRTDRMDMWLPIADWTACCMRNQPTIVKQPSALKDVPKPRRVEVL